MSGQRFQSVDRFIEAVYPVSHIAEQQVQTVPLADRKEVIRAEFSAIDHISLHIFKNRMIRCTSDTRSDYSHPHTGQPQFRVLRFINIMYVFEFLIINPERKFLDTAFAIRIKVQSFFITDP